MIKYSDVEFHNEYYGTVSIKAAVKAEEERWPEDVKKFLETEFGQKVFTTLHNELYREFENLVELLHKHYDKEFEIAYEAIQYNQERVQKLEKELE